jgi:hypothetical protein
MDVLSEYFQWPSSILGAIIQAIQFFWLHGKVATNVDKHRFSTVAPLRILPNLDSLEPPVDRGMELKVYCNIGSILICTVNVSLYCGTEIAEVSGWS